jgi:signal transduction histidine kinase
MKLQTRASLYFLFLLIIIFLAGALIFYSLVKRAISEDATENLLLEKDKLVKYISDSAKFPKPSFLSGDLTYFPSRNMKTEEQLRDTILFNPLEQENQTYRQLTFPAKMNNDYYSISISKPIFESEDLFDTVVLSLALILPVSLIILFLLTRMLSRNMWKPFYRTLDAMQKFDIDKSAPEKLPDEPIKEFRTLNEEVNRMTQRIYENYASLKQFTENASHEMQTPLAIIRSKLDMLIQSESISHGEMSLIRDASESVDRMSHLIQSLLLLSKIESTQFSEKITIDLNVIIENKLHQFEEMIRFRKISVTMQMTKAPDIAMNPYSADILVSNLIGNAIQHNLDRGNINIALSKESLTITNTGLPLTVSPEKLFDRFQKSDPSSSSAGLGLSIVRQICILHNFQISYSYTDRFHTVTILFG